MITGNFRIHRWVFLVEMLGCFGPATLAWWFFTFGPPAGIAHWNGAMLESYLQQTTFAGHYALGLHAGHAISGLVAPIGLLLGLRYVLRNRGLDNRALGFALIAAPVLQTIAGFIGVVAFEVPALPPGVFLLLIGLPIAGIIHLMHLARPAGSAPADARLAAT